MKPYSQTHQPALLHLDLLQRDKVPQTYLIGVLDYFECLFYVILVAV